LRLHPSERDFCQREKRMIEHLPPDKIELFLARSLAPDELLAAARHLSNCEECRLKIDQATLSARIHRIREEMRESEHLSYEQLEAYVDDSLTLADRITVSEHLDLCASCLKEARDLESLRDALEAYPRASRVAATTVEPSQKFLSAFQTKSYRIVWAVAALMIAVVAAGLFVWRSGNPLEIAQSPTQNQDDKNNDARSAPPDPDQLSPPPPSNANTAAHEPEYESVIKQAVANERIAQPATIKDLTGKASTLMGRGEDTTFVLLSPAGTLILSDRPTFRWQRLEGASAYKVAVLDTSFNVVMESGPIAQTQWTASRSLARGRVYLWQVTASRDGREITAPAAPQPEARFKIVSRVKAKELLQLANESHVTAGIIYAHNGLLDDAERELQTAIEKNQEATLAMKLLQSVKAMRQ